MDESLPEGLNEGLFALWYICYPTATAANDYVDVAQLLLARLTVARCGSAGDLLLIRFVHGPLLVRMAVAVDVVDVAETPNLVRTRCRLMSTGVLTVPIMCMQALLVPLPCDMAMACSGLLPILALLVTSALLTHSPTVRL